MVEIGTLSTYIAAARYNIPRRTLRNRLASGSTTRKLGRSAILTTEQETGLVRISIRLADVGMPLTSKMLRVQAFSFCKIKKIPNSFNDAKNTAWKKWLRIHWIHQGQAALYRSLYVLLLHSKHVQESQYLLQVVKCDDCACCGHVRSFLRSILSKRFFIPPYPILQSSSGLCIPKPQEHDGKTFATFLLRRSLGMTPTHECFNKLVYDLYCPSLQKNRQQLVERTCQWCGLYFCTKKKVKEHVNPCHKQLKPSNNSLEMHNVRPSRILTRRSIGRSREILCVVRENDDTEWHDPRPMKNKGIGAYLKSLLSSEGEDTDDDEKNEDFLTI
ncbi:unnamed protein product [Euphydryas editha]|uniref:C2H2-type domain-containing protein n=1 Tax=Euphydryas editha TaxID=104508 RepID=A0AAU9TRH2_EUPED|nr:unnamed protein product [Euphydryas editha]